jgi:hypothetical protein
MRTQKNDPQDVKERRESNRRLMTNFIENQLTIQNQKESGQGPANAVERQTIGARAHESSTQRNEKHAELPNSEI